MKTLYGIAYEIHYPTHTVCNFEYLHASNQAAARFKFIASRNYDPKINIVAIAPVVGAFALETKDKDRFVI